MSLSIEVQVLKERISDLESAISDLREDVGSMEKTAMGMSESVCRAMARYWEELANRIAREAEKDGNG